MKVIKPNKLSVLTRCFERERQTVMGVSVLVFVPLSPSLSLFSEASLWTFAAERMGPQAALEAGVPKSRGEFLVHGSCFAPGGVPHPRVPVSARVGECERALMVTGDRYWKPGGSPSEPQPFETMPLDWSRTYGGPRYPRNPEGRGHGESEYMGQQVQLLPNIEDPDALVLARRDRVDPAGFGPMDISWPQRRSLAGTYDRRWLEGRFPGLADDADWRLFNLAQPPQQIDGFWDGGEAYRFDNMHPQRPVLEGELPRLRTRAYVGRRAGGDSQGDVELESVELSLRTLWMFPDVERAVLIFQGSTAVRHDDASDVDILLVGAEHEDRPRSPEHYATVLESRLDPEHGIIAALREHELLPEGVAEAPDEQQAAEEALHQTERKLEHNLHRRATREYERAAQDLRDQGIDPVTFGLEPPAPPPPAPSPDELPALVETLKAEADEERVRQEASIEQSREQTAAQLEALGFGPEQRERLTTPEANMPVGPPTFTAEGQREQMEALVEQVREAGGPTDELEQQLFDPQLRERWEEAEAKLRQSYIDHAHLQDPVPRMTEERSAEARAVVRDAVAQGRSVRTLDLSGADLSGMDLQGADLSEALLEGSCLDGADLRGSTLRGAVLAHASLRKSRLDGANLQGANLGRSVMHEASLIEADLSSAELMEAQLRGAVLRRANVRGVGLLRADLTDVDASEIETERLQLIEVEATGLCLQGAQLSEAILIQIDLRRGDLSRARLDQATFLDCDVQEVSFVGASLEHARFVKECRLDGARFVGAQLAMSNLRGSSMHGCDLSQARLDGADLSECTLGEAKFYRAVARGTRFDKADLSDASLVAANLMRASFLNAVVRGADLRGSNLYAADMARVRTDDRVQLDQANLTKVRIHPRHEEVPT